MPYQIPHRFLERLNHTEHLARMRYMVIGTFNPGRPLPELMTAEEKEAFDTLSLTPKFRRNDAALNFYDRAQNRWWGTWDRITNPGYYLQHGIDSCRLHGLKHYVANPDRAGIFALQQAFCGTHGIFITDLVRKITTDILYPVYNNYADTFIDQNVPEDGWNTMDLIEVIDACQPDGVLFTFRPNQHTIPNITLQVDAIIEAFPAANFLLTPAGVGGNTYLDLVADYQQKMPIHLREDSTTELD